MLLSLKPRERTPRSPAPRPCEKVCDTYVVSKVYFWNLTNPQAVVDGLEPPKLQEVRLRGANRSCHSVEMYETVRDIV